MVRDALTSPETYVVYALIQAVAFLMLFRFLDLYEREPLAVVASMAVCGATVAIAGARLANDVVVGALPETIEITFGAAAAAPVEEVTKALVLFVAFVVSRALSARFGWLEFEGVTDGIVYGAAVGLGFAFTEDLRYLVTNPLSGFLDYRERVDLFGATTLGHAAYTAAFGAGLGFATWVRGFWRVAAPAAGLIVAIAMHALHNGLAHGVMAARFGTDAYLRFKQPTPSEPNPHWDPDTLGQAQVAEMSSVQRVANDIVENIDHAFVGLVLIGIALWLAHQRSVIRSELTPEVESGLITSSELDMLGRYWRRSRAYWGMLSRGKIDEWRARRRLDNELVDLAFLKWRIRVLGQAPATEARLAWCRERVIRRRRLELDSA